MTDMPCADCGKTYPWRPEYWPSMTYAQCWVCWKVGADEQVRAANRAKWLYEHQWILLPLGVVIGAYVAWLVVR